MADTISYNGVTIQNPELASVDMQAVYDEGDQTSQYTKVTLRINGTLTGSDTGNNYSGDAAVFIANITAAKTALMTPRGNLVVQVGETNLFNITAPDMVGGPKPRRCTVTEFVGGRLAVVNWEVEFATKDCLNSGTNAQYCSNVMSNRYAITHAIDDKFYTTRTINGTLRVRENLGAANPDLLRGLIVPGLPAGFRREVQEFGVQPDGLALKYTIVDREVYRVAPSTCVKASASFSTQLSDLIWYNHVSVEVEGHKLQNKLDMYNSAMTIAKSRISFDDTKQLLRAATLQEDLFENVVRLQFTTMLTGDTLDNANGYFPANSKLFGSVTNDTNNAILGPYATALICAAKQAFYDPCGTTNGASSSTVSLLNGETTSIGGSSQYPSGGYVPTYTTNSLTGSSSAPTGTAGALNNSTVNMYLSYHDKANYYQNNGIVVLPATSPLVPARGYQLHNPYQVLTQDGYAERIGAPCKIPAPVYQAHPDAIVLSRSVNVSAPRLLNDKTHYVYAASWHYQALLPLSNNLAYSGTSNYVDGMTSGSFLPPLNDATTLLPNAATINTYASGSTWGTGYSITPK